MGKPVGKDENEMPCRWMEGDRQDVKKLTDNSLGCSLSTLML